MGNTSKSEFTITKTQCELYKIRHKSGCYWADITIDHKDATGRIQIASDYGSWQNYWGSCGCSFKEFLIKLNNDIHYTASKFGASDWFDLEKTKQSIYQEIVNSRKNRETTAGEAREYIDELKEIYATDANCFMVSFMETECFAKVFDHDPCSVECEISIHPHFRKFWEEAWAVFIEELKCEVLK